MRYELKVLPEVKWPMAQLEKEWDKCEKCIISEWGFNVVHARGQVPCQVLFIGEAPGKTEDLIGLPFIGISGRKVLQPMIQQAMEAKPFTYAVTNMVACRPTDNLGGANRAPYDCELNNCRPRLIKFITQIAKPKVLVLLGKTAKENAPEWAELPKLNLYHPAFIHRQGGQSSKAFAEDLTKLIAFVKKELK